MADLKRGDNINATLPSLSDGTLARLCKSEIAELCGRRPLDNRDNIGLSGWLA